MGGIPFYAWIPVVLLALAIFARYVWPHILRGYLKLAEKKGNICDACKGNMIEVSEHLRMLPVRFDESHDRSSAYYMHSTMAIDDISQVPTGSRACKIFLLQCQNCGIKEVAVMDFLPVRGQEVLKNADIFPYEEFREFYETMETGRNINNTRNIDEENVSRYGIHH